MKTTVVPAQVTTVEDKVAGNLSFTQLLLLITPVFIGGGVYVAVPPFFGFTYLKLLICAIISVVCMTLAIRIKGKILLNWLVVLTRYATRPRLYLFNKNDSYLRKAKPDGSYQETPTLEIKEETKTNPEPVSLEAGQLLRAEAAIADPESKFHLKTVKGGLRVVITEVE